MCRKVESKYSENLQDDQQTGHNTVRMHYRLVETDAKRLVEGREQNCIVSLMHGAMPTLANSTNI